MKFDAMVALELEVIVEEIRSLNQRIARLEKTIAEQGSQREGHKNLTSIKGIGPLAEEGKLAAYFGIVPRVSKTPTKPSIPGESSNAAANWGEPRWCSAP
jgi:hypothetical protein